MLVVFFCLKDYLKLLSTNLKFVILGRKEYYKPVKKRNHLILPDCKEKAVSLFMPLKSNLMLPWSGQREWGCIIKYSLNSETYTCDLAEHMVLHHQFDSSPH